MGERDSYAPGTFCWADLSTPDPARAGKFYSDLFGWKLTDDTDDDPPSGYVHIQNGQEFMGGITLKADGLAMCAGREADECGDPNKKDDPIEFTVMPAKAEPYRFALISADKQTKAFFQVVPDPISNEDHGCKLQVVRLLPKFEVTLVKLTGFPPNEDVQMNSQSYDEKKDLKIHTDADGMAMQAWLPFVKDKTSGKTQINARSGKCSPKLSFEWGR